MSLLENTINRIGTHNDEVKSAAKNRLDQLTMPHWALGRIMDLGLELAGITGSMAPDLKRRVVAVFAGDHGIAAEGVSKYPQEVTVQMVRNFLNGGAAINAVSRVAGADVVVVDMGVAGDLSDVTERENFRVKKVSSGTANMFIGPAMTLQQAVASIEAGIEIADELAGRYDVMATGDMGIGNTTASSAITSVITGLPCASVTGRGTGIDDDQFASKCDIITKILELNQPDRSQPLEILAKVGGFEIGGIAGFILGAAANRKPVVIDGFISTAGALIAHELCPKAAAFMIPGHRSVEQGHRAALSYLKKEPLLDLDLRLGEGTGAAMAMPLLDAAVMVMTKTATFEEAAVSKAD